MNALLFGIPERVVYMFQCGHLVSSVKRCWMLSRLVFVSFTCSSCLGSVEIFLTSNIKWVKRAARGWQGASGSPRVKRCQMPRMACQMPKDAKCQSLKHWQYQWKSSAAFKFKLLFSVAPCSQSSQSQSTYGKSWMLEMTVSAATLQFFRPNLGLWELCCARAFHCCCLCLEAPGFKHAGVSTGLVW